MKASQRSKSIMALIATIVTATSIMATSMYAIINNTPNYTPVVTAQAYNTTESTFGGNEKADMITEFNNDYTIQNKYKLYSAFRGMGMTKEQACAALGSAACEGSFHSEIIEYADASQANNTTGGHKHSEVDGDLGSITNRDNYINKWSSRIEDPDYRTKCTDDTMRSYGVSEDTIKALHDPTTCGNYHSVGTNIGFNIDASFYYPKGVGTTGCGFYGFTGEVLYDLFDFANERNKKWYDADTQISFLLAGSENGGYHGGSYTIAEYIETTKDYTDVDACVEVWCKVIGSVNSSQLAARKDQARAIIAQFPNSGYDVSYASKVLIDAGFEAVEDRKGILDEGIIQHYAHTSIVYPQSNGFILDNNMNIDSYDNNSEVFKEYIANLKGRSATSASYSLFELFGEDLHWYRYLGEATYTPQLMDHIWSAVDQDKTDELIKHPFDTINYEAYNYLSCQVYPGRPEVLTSEDLDNGDVDPRVTALKNGWFNGYTYVVGSFQLAISKGFVSIVALLTGPTLRQETVKVLEILEGTEAWSFIKPLILIVLAFSVVAFVISLVKKAVKYSVGTGSAKDAVIRFLIGFMCIGLTGAGVANPAILNATINKGIGIVDNIFDASLAKFVENDEVIAVNDPDKVIHAAIWRRAIFGAWCRGQFNGREYEELYTQFASLSSGQSKMPQSHDVIDYSDMSGKAYYDSATSTGDIGVPVGGGKIIKNWAAYLYSCGSKYHIDSTIDKKIAEKVDISRKIYFPHNTLMTTANDPSIEADLFRVVDAQMDISPQYFTSGSVVNSYKNAHKIKTHFMSQGTIMLFNCALLLFLVPVIFKKIFSFILLMITIIKMIYYTIVELFKENAGLPDFWSTCKKHAVDYFVACLKLNLMVTFYYMFVDQGFFKLVVYVVLCIVILGFSVRDVRKFGMDIKTTIAKYKAKGHI